MQSIRGIAVSHEGITGLNPTCTTWVNTPDNRGQNYIQEQLPQQLVTVRLKINVNNNLGI